MDNTKDAEKVFDHWASRYAEKYMDTRLYHESFGWFCDAVLAPSPQILELGCGPGNITKFLMTTRPDFQMLATDISEKMLTLTRKNNPEVETRKLDCRNMTALDLKFDGVIAGFCLPYLSPDETSEWISALKTVLNEGGTVYISTMEGDFESSSYKKSSTGEGPALYINYYPEDFLVQLLESNGFRILRTEIIYYSNESGETVSDLVILARKLN